MAKSYARTRGYIPQILDMDGDDYMYLVLDESIVQENGCWIWQGWADGPVRKQAAAAQVAIYKHFGVEIPEGQYVFNTCSDDVFCFNPLCLALGETDEA